MKSCPPDMPSSNQSRLSVDVIDVRSETIPDVSNKSSRLTAQSHIRMRYALKQAANSRSQQQMVGTACFVGGTTLAVVAGSLLTLDSASQVSDTVMLEGPDALEMTGSQKASMVLSEPVSAVRPSVQLSELPSPVVRFSGTRQATEQMPTAESARLVTYKVQIGRQLSQVELKLVGLRQHLALDAYEKSFIDQLLDQDARYQSQLQQLKAIDIEMALEAGKTNGDQVRLAELNRRAQRAQVQLRQVAQAVLARHMTHAQGAVVQEPLYQHLLTQLTDYTHEHKVLRLRQENVEVAKAQLEKRYT